MYNWGSIEHDYPWADHEVWTGQAQEYPEVECCSKRFALETAITTPGQIHDWIASQLALTLTIPSYERGVARLLRYDRHP